MAAKQVKSGGVWGGEAGNKAGGGYWGATHNTSSVYVPLNGNGNGSHRVYVPQRRNYCRPPVIAFGVVLAVASGIGLAAMFGLFSLPVLEESVVIPQDVKSVWDFVANFENVEKWDPGVKSSTKATDGATAVGTVYDVTVDFKGSEDPMKYTVREWEPNSKVVLFGEGSKVTGLDTISFSKETPSDGSSGEYTRVTYTADIQLRGFLKVGSPFVKNDIIKVGKDAMNGLRKHYGIPEVN